MDRIINQTFVPTEIDGKFMMVITQYIWSDGEVVERKTIYDGAGYTTTTETVIKDPAILATETQAETDAGAIPGWATWTTQQAVDYINTNVTDLASAKTVMVAMAKLLVALRGKAFPGLGE